MRVKITAVSDQTTDIPFHYNYALHAAIYNLIAKSSDKYAQYLHDKGFLNESLKKRFKLFTFSKLFCQPLKIYKYGFKQVRQVHFFFSTPMEKSYEHLILGLFSDQSFFLNLSGRKISFTITRVEALPAPEFKTESRFLCLSPIAVSTLRDKPDGNPEQHYLDYMNPAEREHSIENIQKNLINKYATVNGRPYTDNDHEFTFSFDPAYIAKRQGRISKLIQFKQINGRTRSKIKHC